MKAGTGSQKKKRREPKVRGKQVDITTRPDHEATNILEKRDGKEGGGIEWARRGR
jgi:hypothetical protein